MMVAFGGDGAAFTFDGGWTDFTLDVGSIGILVRPEPLRPRDWYFCREPGSVEFQAGRHVMTISWGRWETDKEVRWSAPFARPWAWTRIVEKAAAAQSSASEAPAPAAEGGK